MTTEPPKSDTIRIVVVDDHLLMRDGIVDALSGEPDFDMVGSGGSALDALDLASRMQPDVILVDINMPGSGLQAVARISAAHPGVAAIVVSSREDVETVTTALRNGARGYVVKGVTARELAGIIRTVHSGESYVTPTLAARLLARPARPNRGTA